MKRWTVLCLIFLQMAAMLGGCRTIEGENSEESDVQGETVRLYYTNDTSTTLHEESIILEEEMSSKERVEQVMRKLQEPPEGFQSIVPEGIRVVYNITLSDTDPQKIQLIQLSVRGEYENLAPNVENVFRVGLMKSLIRMQNVNCVELYANQKKEDGTSGLVKVSSLTQDTVIVNESDENFFKDNIEVTLYFLDEDGDKLVTETRSATVMISDRIVDRIMAMLIAGPQDKSHKASIPEGTVVNEVLLRNGVCYVDVNEAFVKNQVAGETTESLTIYSIVNSLTQIYGVNSVQFLIDGQQKEYYKSNVKINTPLKANMDWVDKD